MDLKSKVLLGVLIASIVLSVAALFYKTIILQDFVVIEHEDGEIQKESAPTESTDSNLDTLNPK